jgi:hypothetical protein
MEMEKRKSTGDSRWRRKLRQGGRAAGLVLPMAGKLCNGLASFRKIRWRKTPLAARSPALIARYQTIMLDEKLFRNKRRFVL